MIRRKIVWQDGFYQVLKPKNEHGWQRYGQRKSIKAISDLLLRAEKGGYELTYSEAIAFEVAGYRRNVEKRIKNFRKKKGLESKTI